MFESYKYGLIVTQDDADKRAKALGTLINGSDNWSGPGWPLNAGDIIFIDGIEELYDELQDGPLYAYYAGDNGDTGHMVLVTGVNIKRNVVFTNNPNGYMDFQYFDEFLLHHTSNPFNNEPLYGCYPAI